MVFSAARNSHNARLLSSSNWIDLLCYYWKHSLSSKRANIRSMPFLMCLIDRQELSLEILIEINVHLQCHVMWSFIERSTAGREMHVRFPINFLALFAAASQYHKLLCFKTRVRILQEFWIATPQMVLGVLIKTFCHLVLEGDFCTQARNGVSAHFSLVVYGVFWDGVMFLSIVGAQDQDCLSKVSSS